MNMTPWPKWYRAGLNRQMVTVAPIVFNHAEYVTGYSRHEICGSRGDRDLISARQAVMAELHRRGFSYSQIGRAMKRDHTTVIHGVRAIREKAAADPYVAEMMEDMAA